MKEFLSRHGIPFVLRDMHVDPHAALETREHEIDVFPTLVRGDEQLTVLHVGQLREWLGLPDDEEPAGYLDLVAACERVLKAVERAARAIPDDQLETRTPNRGRDAREMIFNIHAPLDALAASLDSGRFVYDPTKDFAHSRRFGDARALADYCATVRSRWVIRALGVTAADQQRILSTDRGDLTQHQMLDFLARHAAGHLRQLYVFLRERGVSPDGELNEEEMSPIIVTAELY